MKRFLMMLATVMLLVSVLATGVFAETAEAPVCYAHGDVDGDGTVTSDDAIYVLFHTYSETLYPVKQDCDFNKEDGVTSDDAIYVLFNVFDPAQYPLEGMIHNYYDPVWDWKNVDGSMVPSVAFQCGCAEGNHTYTTTEEADMPAVAVEADSKEASCMEAGYTQYSASITLDGKAYTSQYTVTVPANGQHNTEGKTPTCEEAVECVRCHEVVTPAKGHDMKKTGTVAATCQAEGSVTYTCANNCGETETEPLEKIDHTYAYFETKNEGCKYTKYYKCSGCGDEKAGTAETDTYEQHSFKTELTVEATCQQAGEKVTTCSNDGCDYKETETVSQNPDAHKWGEGVKGDGVITYTCADCDETKEVVDASVAVSADELSTEQELAAGTDGTTVQLDETAADAIKAGTEAVEGASSVAISVEKVTDLTNVPMDDEQKEQLGENPVVYDFNMFLVDENGNKIEDAEGNNEKISNFGENASVTISLPYTLAAGEDVDSINVWFVSDSGDLTAIKGEYANGFVTFTTNHFSYYTVTRLTPDQRCELYGHEMVDSNTPATCVSEGHDKEYCQRCGYLVKDVKTDPKGHDYEVDTATSKAATCTTYGVKVETCKNCTHTVTTTLFATGHNYQLDEQQSTEASCEAAGVKVYVCANNCGQTREEKVKQLQHAFKKVEDVAATCLTNGYTLNRCELCKKEEKVGETPALGHIFQNEDAEWTWDEDTYSASVKLVCATDADHTVELKAVVNPNTSGCVTSGYTAVVSHNNQKFFDTCEFDEAIANHKPAEEWQSNATSHWHVCTNESCNAELGKASHNWGEETVIKAPTCKNAGTAEVSCTVCEYTTTKAIPATGEHNFNSEGVCTDCGYVEGKCDHIRIHREDIDVSAYDTCAGFKPFYDVCECGTRQGLGWYIECDFDYENTTEEKGTLPNDMEIMLYSQSCKNCGLTVTSGDYTLFDEDACMGYTYVYEKLSFDGTTIAELLYPEPMIERAHPSDEEKNQTVDLAALGLCEGTVLELYECFCGESYYGNERAVSDGCHWALTDSAPDGTVDTYTCVNCGAVKTIVFNNQFNKQTCETTYARTVTYSVEGVEIYSFENVEFWTEHTYITTSYELDGDSCEDGVLITRVCENCGDEQKEYAVWHTSVQTTETDLSDKNICANTLFKSVCACGENVQYYFDNGCLWTWEYGREHENGYVCSVCGAQKVETYSFGEKGENCECEVTITTTYTDRNGEHIVTTVGEGNGINHNYMQNVKLLGDSCTDGVEITWVCEDCGTAEDEVRTIYEHEGVYTLQHYDLSAFDSCFTAVNIHKCACGEEVWSGWECDDQPCQFQWQDGSGVCVNCGLTQVESCIPGETIDDCHSQQYVTITLSKEGCQSITFSYDGVATHHAGETFEMTLVEGAADCTEGVHIVMHCSTCGEEENRGIQYYHATYPISREYIYDGDELCGKREKVTYNCGCGENDYTSVNWVDGQCFFNWYTYDEKTQQELYRCDACGTIMTEEQTTVPVEDGEPCEVIFMQNSTYYLDEAAYENGDVLFVERSEGRGFEHDYLCSYIYADPNNQTCEGGYYVSRTCAVCGESNTDDYISYDNYTRTVERDVLHDGEGICGPVVWYKNECACGYGHWHSDTSSCIWTWSDDEDCEVCTECGLKRTTISNTTAVEGKCAVMITENVTYTLPNDTVINRQFVSTQEEHQFEHTFRLLGETCDDGYYVDVKCANCDESSTGEDLFSGCQHWELKAFNLAEYGACSSKYVFTGCACGNLRDGGWNELACNWYHTDTVDPDTGMPVQKCNSCGMYLVEGRIGQLDAENCVFNGSFCVKLYDDNGVKFNESMDVTATQHTGIAYDFQCYGDHCNDGYTIFMKCAYCTNTWTEESDPYDGDWHNGRDTQVPFDLSAYGACAGSEIRVGRCPCGQESYVSHDLGCEQNGNWEYGIKWWQETGEDGIVYDYSMNQCSVCGLTSTNKSWYTETDDDCVRIRHVVYTYTKEGTDLNASFTQDTEEWNHNYEVTHYELVEGATSCEDGVEITCTCTRCGESYSYVSEGSMHNIYFVDSTDLTQFGAVCDSQLNHYSCPCGQKQRYDITEDSQCDWDHSGVIDGEGWIADAIEYTEMKTTGGHYWVDSYFANITCAVTNPQCGIKLRMAEFYLKEGCEAVEYQSWEVYNETTGQYETLVPTVATGERYAFHDYQQTTTTENQADGTEVYTDRWECACGSYRENKYYLLNGEHIDLSDECVNTLYATNGDSQRCTYKWEYDLEENGYRYQTLRYYENVNVDGNLFWEKYEYTYDFSDGCWRTFTATDSNGNQWSETEEAHVVTWTSERKEPTCSQPGYENYFDQCVVCGTRYDGYNGVLIPGHNWSPDPDNNCSVCLTCGLQNANGADGTIVMEDLTDAYGNGTDYVVGYYIKNDQGYSAYVSILLKDVTEGDDMIVLNDVVVSEWTPDTHGITALAFNMADAQAAAEAAVAEAVYTGEYAIRINMVPMSGDTTLDYAITFDSLTA